MGRFIDAWSLNDLLAQSPFLPYLVAESENQQKQECTMASACKKGHEELSTWLVGQAIFIPKPHPRYSTGTDP
jgi:hypothetical protein